MVSEFLKVLSILWDKRRELKVSNLTNHRKIKGTADDQTYVLTNLLSICKTWKITYEIKIFKLLYNKLTLSLNYVNPRENF